MFIGYKESIERRDHLSVRGNGLQDRSTGDPDNEKREKADIRNEFSEVGGF